MGTLTKGKHAHRRLGTCLMEAICAVNGEPHSGQPRCVAPGLIRLGHALNDGPWATDEERSSVLEPLIPLMIGTSQGAVTMGDMLALRDILETRSLPALLEVLGGTRELALAERLRGPLGMTEACRTELLGLASAMEAACFAQLKCGLLLGDVIGVMRHAATHPGAFWGYHQVAHAAMVCIMEIARVHRPSLVWAAEWTTNLVVGMRAELKLDPPEELAACQERLRLAIEEAGKLDRVYVHEIEHLGVVTMIDKL